MGATAENRIQSWMEDRSDPYIYPHVRPIVGRRALLYTLYPKPFKSHNLVYHFL